MESQSPRLKNFAISWFAVTMGLFGFTIAWSRTEHILHLDFTLSRLFLSRLRFYLSWWAYSFPIAALTIATLIMREDSGLGVYSGIAGSLLVCLTILIAMLVVLTALRIARRTICIEEEHW